MKKIILCIILLFMTSACFDYNEINNIAILNGLGIDYQDNNYIVTYELINTDKQSENNDVSKKSYTITNEAPTLEEAILKNNNTIPKKISFENISIMVISQRIAKLGLTKITDYFIRDNNLTTNFYVVLTDDTPQKILNYQDAMKNINAETITKLITNSNANITLTKKAQLDFLMAQIKDNKQDIVLPSININNGLEITNLGVFKMIK
jgi:spore germination protein KC